ncbi:MAG TPA: YdiU family protein [Xanthomonadales bacterium]|nr:YdiU family protein [Xanthomonadales bacterium]
MNFNNSYTTLPEEFYQAVTPNHVAEPELIAWNHELASKLGLDMPKTRNEQLASVFSGSIELEGSQPISMAYAGHQFGHFVPQLGDGRAALLGEIVTESGDRFDVQLKGSGRTPFSRGGDGKSWLGPVLREYILSEAMHHLGVPTTRALAAVATGETVFRESALPGAVFTRVATSHLRVGTFQYFAARNAVGLLRKLADYAIDRHYPEVKDEKYPYVGLLRCVSERQAELIAHWMSVGFIHGVMNTDNTTISGETIDYGPAAYLDEFRFDKVFSSIDTQGRYAYANQPAIALWNMARFAETLLVLKADKGELEAVLAMFRDQYESHYLALMRPKLGLCDVQENDAGLISEWLKHLHDNRLDYTLSFRELASRADASDESRFGLFESRWRQRIGSQDRNPVEISALMNSVNPLFIPRNHRVEQAINEALEGDFTVFNELNAILLQPYAEQPGLSHLAEAPEEHQRVTRTFCGT